MGGGQREVGDGRLTDGWLGPRSAGAAHSCLCRTPGTLPAHALRCHKSWHLVASRPGGPARGPLAGARAHGALGLSRTVQSCPVRPTLHSLAAGGRRGCDPVRWRDAGLRHTARQMPGAARRGRTHARRTPRRMPPALAARKPRSESAGAQARQPGGPTARPPDLPTSRRPTVSPGPQLQNHSAGNTAGGPEQVRGRACSCAPALYCSGAARRGTARDAPEGRGDGGQGAGW